MAFIDGLKDLFPNIIQHVTFKDRTVTITFKSGNKLQATCPDGNDQYDILKDHMLKTLKKEQVEIYD